MSNTTKVLITIQGGVVRSVITTNADIQIILLDIDEHAEEPTRVIPVHPSNIGITSDSISMHLRKYQHGALELDSDLDDEDLEEVIAEIEELNA